MRIITVIYQWITKRMVGVDNQWVLRIAIRVKYQWLIMRIFGLNDRSYHRSVESKRMIRVKNSGND